MPRAETRFEKVPPLTRDDTVSGGEILGIAARSGRVGILADCGMLEMSGDDALTIAAHLVMAAAVAKLDDDDDGEGDDDGLTLRGCTSHGGRNVIDFHIPHGGYPVASADVEWLVAPS